MKSKQRVINRRGLTRLVVETNSVIAIGASVAISWFKELTSDQSKPPKVCCYSAPASKRTTVSRRGPWTPRMRVISISDVAEGPEIVVIAMALRLAMAASASGSSSCTCPRCTRQMWWSGSKVIARRPCAPSCTSSIVPVEATATSHVVTTASIPSICSIDSCASTTTSTPFGSHAFGERRGGEQPKLSSTMQRARDGSGEIGLGCDLDDLSIVVEQPVLQQMQTSVPVQ